MQKVSIFWRFVSLTDWMQRIRLLPSARRVGKNSIWLLLAKLVTQLQLLGLTILIARRLGEATFGQYALISSVVVLGNVFTTFGTDTLLIRQTARARQVDVPELPAALTLQLILSVLFIAGIWLWTAVSHPMTGEFSGAVRLYALSLLPLAFFSVFTAVLRGFERMDLYLVAGFGSSIVQLIIVWVALMIGGGLFEIMGALLMVQLISTIFTYALCKMGVPDFAIHFDLSFRNVLSLLKAAWPLALLSVLGVAYLRLGIFSLSILGSDTQTGLFSAVSRIVEALKFGHIALLGALLPALSGLHAIPSTTRLEKVEVSRLFKQSAAGLLVLGMAGAITLALLAHPLIVFIYGTRYQAAEPAMRLLAWVLVPYSASSVLTIDLIARGKERSVTAALGISLAAGIALNLVWVPGLGLQGACLAALAAECIQAVLLGSYFIYLRKPGQVRM